MKEAQEKKITVFDEKEVITKEQLSEYWTYFPYAVQKSLNRCKRGLLPAVSDSDLEKVVSDYRCAPVDNDDVRNGARAKHEQQAPAHHTEHEDSAAKRYVAVGRDLADDGHDSSV